jgi:thioredoxin 1
VPEVTDQTFDDEVLKASTPVLVDFYGVNCAPCKQMEPVINETANEFAGKVKFVRCDVEQNPRVAMQYSVNTMPTFIVFKGGQRGDAYTGLVPKGILAETLNKALQ